MNRNERRKAHTTYIKEYPHAPKTAVLVKNGVEKAVDLDAMYEIHEMLQDCALTHYAGHPHIKDKLRTARAAVKDALDALQQEFWS